MPRKADLSHLPEIPDGITMGELARVASLALGREVSTEDAYAAVVKRRVVPVGRRRIMITRPREEERQVIKPTDVPVVLAHMADMALDEGTAAS